MALGARKIDFTEPWGRRIHVQKRYSDSVDDLSRLSLLFGAREHKKDDEVAKVRIPPRKKLLSERKVLSGGTFSFLLPFPAVNVKTGFKNRVNQWRHRKKSFVVLFILSSALAFFIYQHYFYDIIHFEIFTIHFFLLLSAFALHIIFVNKKLQFFLVLTQCSHLLSFLPCYSFNSTSTFICCWAAAAFFFFHREKNDRRSRTK